MICLNKNKYLFYAGFFLGLCCLSPSWAAQPVLDNSSAHNQQIARGEESRGGGYRGGTPREQHNVNQDIRHDSGQGYRSDYNGRRYEGDYNRNYGSEFAPTYVAPIVPAVYNSNGVVDPAYTVDPYLLPPQ